MDSAEQNFDAGVELSNLRRGLDYGISEMTWYHACRAVMDLDRAIGEIVVWSIRPSKDGCTLTGFNASREYHIRLESPGDSATVVLAVREGLDEPGTWRIAFTGSDCPESWVQLIEKVGEIENTGVYLPNWVSETATLWDEYRRYRGY
jgi:hypothetical protein